MFDVDAVQLVYIEMAILLVNDAGMISRDDCGTACWWVPPMLPDGTCCSLARRSGTFCILKRVVVLLLLRQELCTGLCPSPYT